MWIQLQSLKTSKPRQLCKPRVYSVYAYKCARVHLPNHACGSQRTTWSCLLPPLHGFQRSDSGGWAYMANSCICCTISLPSVCYTCHCFMFYLVISSSSFLCKARSSNSVLLPQLPDCRDCRCVLSGLTELTKHTLGKNYSWAGNVV